MVCWLAVAPGVGWAAVRLLGLDRGPLVQLLAFTPYVAAGSLVPLVLALALRRRWPAVVAAVATVLDITDRRRAEEALREQEELAELVESSRLVVKAAVIEGAMDEWPPAVQRRLQQMGQGLIWASHSRLMLSRSTPMPPA